MPYRAHERTIEVYSKNSNKNMINNYMIYVHVFPNSKIYFGITNNINLRWKHNGTGYKSQKLIYRAIKKYGWNNIEHIVLYDNLTKEQACQMEIDYIKYYDTTNSNNGYNCSTGGESGATGVIRTAEQNKINSLKHLGKKHTEETKKLLSKINKGKIFTEEHKLHLKENHTNEYGVNNAFYGKHHKKESLQKISGKNNYRAKSVICVETNEVFDTITMASIQYGINKTDISKCCNGKQKSAGKLINGDKLHWKFCNDMDNKIQ